MGKDKEGEKVKLAENRKCMACDKAIEKDRYLICQKCADSMDYEAHVCERCSMKGCKRN